MTWNLKKKKSHTLEVSDSYAMMIQASHSQNWSHIYYIIHTHV